MEKQLGVSKMEKGFGEDKVKDTLHTGVLIAAKGKVIDRKKVSAPKMKLLNGYPNRVEVHTNVNSGFKAKVVITAFENPIEIGNNGIPMPETIPIRGKKVLVKQPKSIEAGIARIKDLAITDIRCLDIDQGMKSALVT